MTKEHLIPFKKGQSGNPKGRPPMLSKKIASMPKEARDEIYSILYECLTFENISEAVAFLQKDARLGKYGFIKQLAINTLADKHKGWIALMDILDRLFGRPKQTNENHNINTPDIVVRSEEEKKKLENMKNLNV